MLKVMVLGLRGFPDVQGGVEKHAEHLYPLLVQLGCRVDVIVRSSYVTASRRSWQGIRYRRLWAPKLKGIEALFHSLSGVIYAGIVRPDILHIHAIGPAIVTPLARMLGLKVVVTHHGPDYDREKWGVFAGWLLRLGEAWGMRYSNRRIVISNVIRELVKKKYKIESNVIPNGIVPPVIPGSDKILQKYNLDKGRYVLMVSRFVPEKRHLDLINAFKSSALDGWKLVLVGEADHPDKYSEMVIGEAKRTPNVILTGFQTGLALQELYAHAGLFVLPSSHEGLPIVMLEALSYGIPVVASDIPANLEIGLPTESYFKLGDVAGLADTLTFFAGGAGHNQKLVSDYGRLLVRYNWTKIAGDTIQVYQMAIH